MSIPDFSPFLTCIARSPVWRAEIVVPPRLGLLNNDAAKAEIRRYVLAVGDFVDTLLPVESVLIAKVTVNVYTGKTTVAGIVQFQGGALVQIRLTGRDDGVRFTIEETEVFTLKEE